MRPLDMWRFWIGALLALAACAPALPDPLPVHHPAHPAATAAPPVKLTALGSEEDAFPPKEPATQPGHHHHHHGKP